MSSTRRRSDSIASARRPASAASPDPDEHGIRCRAQRLDDVRNPLAGRSAVVGVEVRNLRRFGRIERREVDGLHNETRRAHLFLEIGIDTCHDHRHLATPARLTSSGWSIGVDAEAEARTQERASALARAPRAASTTTDAARPQSSSPSTARHRRRSAEPGADETRADRATGQV